MSGSTGSASRVIMAIGSVLALLALGLPFALFSSSPSTSRSIPTGVFGGGGLEIWSGWSLARKSHIDGHLPIPLAAATILVVVTVCLVMLAWLALERSTTWILVVAAVLGTALLVSSVVIGTAVERKLSVDMSGTTSWGTAGWGLGVWRVALLLVVVAAIRAVVQSEMDTDAWRSWAPPKGPSHEGRTPPGWANWG